MSRLRGGAPWIAVAAVALAAIVALLAIAAVRGQDSPRGFATISASEGGCTVDRAQSRDVVSCSRISAGVYRIVFARSVAGRAPVATRSTCCPGQILVSVDGDRTVLVSLPRQRRYPVVFSVAVP